jgi:hypothetical protein
VPATDTVNEAIGIISGLYTQRGLKSEQYSRVGQGGDAMGQPAINGASFDLKLTGQSRRFRVEGVAASVVCSPIETLGGSR